MITPVLLAALLSQSPPTASEGVVARPDSGVGTPETSTEQSSLYDFVRLEDLVNPTVSVAAIRAQSASSSPSTVTVFTREQIDLLGARYLSELLRLVPGFDIRRFRETLQLADVRGVSGLANERLLLMLNGVGLNDIYTGGSARSARDMPLANVKRVEIIRGPGSAIYGAGAFAAVVNLTTYDGSEGDEVHARVDYGLYNDQQYVLDVGKKVGEWTLRGSGTYGRSDGSTYNIPVDTLGLSGTVKDTFYGYSGGLSLAYRDMLRLSAFGGIRHDNGFVNIGDLAGPRNDFGEGIWSVGKLDLKVPLSQDITFFGKAYGAFNRVYLATQVWPAGRSPNAAAYPKGTWGVGRVRMPRAGTDDYVLGQFGDHSVIAGFAFEWTSINTADLTNNGDPSVQYDVPIKGLIVLPKNERYIYAGYLQDQWKIVDPLTLTIGVRYDHYSDVGGTTNPRVALNYTPIENLALRGSFGTAFRAPSFTELHIASPIQVGDPNTQPEKIRTAEGQVTYSGWNYLVPSATYFFNDLDGLILTQRDPSDNKAHFRNLGKIRTQGVELELRGAITKTSLWSLNYTFVHGRNTIGSAASFDTPLIVNHMANAMVLADVIAHLRIGADVQVRGKRNRLVGDPRSRIDPVAIVNAQVQAYDLAPGLSVHVRATNLFNTAYGMPANTRRIPTSNVLPSDIPLQGLRLWGGVEYALPI